jgi:hypothetical protein
MKKQFTGILFILIFLLIACTNDGINHAPEGVFIRIDMPEEAFVNRAVDIVYTLSHVEESVDITSSNPDVAYVLHGKLYTVKPGTTVIKIAYRNFNYSTSFQFEVRRFDDLAVMAEAIIIRGSHILIDAYDPNDLYYQGFTFESSDEMVASVNSKGAVFGHRVGVAVIKITSKATGDYIEHTVQVINPDPNELIVYDIDPIYEVNQVIQLESILLPVYSEGQIIALSSNQAIAEINEHFELIIKSQTGEVTLTFYVEGFIDVKVEHQITVISPYTIDDLVSLMMDSEIMQKQITVYGYQGNYTHNLRGSVIPYYFGQLNIQSAMISPSHRNRVNIVAPVHYIVIHDTGSSAASATELAHANWVRNENTSVSWHYTVGANAIYQHLPDEEQGLHAGDGGRVYGLHDTGVIAGEPNPKVTIDANGYYSLNHIKSNIKAPMAGTRIARTSDIVDTGIRVVIGDNGHYMIGTTYWTGSKIGNTGGDRNGVGIEMTIHQGSDLFVAYQKLAKLTAKLIITHRLSPEDVKQHNFYTGKNCPQTLRQANYWDAFIDMVWFEYMMARYFEGYTIEVLSHREDWINNQGRILKTSSTLTSVSFEIVIKNPNGLIVYQNMVERNIPAV